MGIIGVLWLIILVLKVIGVIATSWWLVILWPIPVVLLLFLIMVIFGVTLAGFASIAVR